MKNNIEKKHKFKINKGELVIKIMASFLAILMLLSVCATGIYYFYSYITA